ncbi:CHASE3 domain-containing protein [Usitatibacter palustris]|uniref:Histidine kinase domain-containing protein n=1 Tax=Usitatibacter palustris TaxID=2732487 RepID=A0A6M4H1S9_9PROT|nr:CHASE3 domain-containing protein [Usitatibacter palustris]QJR13459.1 hypothetical protein DSM104440_00243 [Usitatibacter palustris]
MALPEEQRAAPSAPPPVLPLKYWFPLLVALLVTGAILFVSEMSYRTFSQTRGEITQAMAFQARLMELEKTIYEAQAAQRGFLLSHRPEYMDAVKASIAASRPVREQLRDLLPDKPTRERLADLNELVTLKISDLELSLERATGGDMEGAREFVESDKARDLAAKLRVSFGTVQRAATEIVHQRTQRWEEAMESSRTGLLAVVALNATLIALLALLLIRDTRRARMIEYVHLTMADKMKREVADRTAQLSSLSEFLQTQAEMEKARLARELHDELGGILTPAKMDVNWLEGRLGDDKEVATRLERLTRLLDSGIDVKRRIIENLRPSLLDHLGLAAAVKWHVDETCKSANLDCHMQITDALERLPPDVEIALYRVVQESLTNVIRHAQAKRVDLLVERTPEGVIVELKDDGIGIADIEAAYRKSYGIGGNRQRLSGLGGIVDIKSGTGKGTQVRAFVPLARVQPS